MPAHAWQKAISQKVSAARCACASVSNMPKHALPLPLISAASAPALLSRRFISAMLPSSFSAAFASPFDTAAASASVSPARIAAAACSLQPSPYGGVSAENSCRVDMPSAGFTIR